MASTPNESKATLALEEGGVYRLVKGRYIGPTVRIVAVTTYANGKPGNVVTWTSEPWNFATNWASGVCSDSQFREHYGNERVA